MHHISSKSTKIFVFNGFGLFSFVNSAWFVHISLLIQTKLLIHWRKTFQFKCCNDRFMTAFHFSRCLSMDWSGVDYWDVFISCLDSRSDSTHSLQTIYWRANHLMLHLSKSDAETSSSWMSWGCVNFQLILFLVNYFFKNSSLEASISGIAAKKL